MPTSVLYVWKPRTCSPGFRQFGAHDQSQNARVEKQEKRRAKVLNADHFVVGGEIEITTGAMNFRLFGAVKPALKCRPSTADREVDNESDQVRNGRRPLLGQFCFESEIQRQKRRDAGGDATHESQGHQLSPSVNCWA
jgi:hypothetical protein